MTTRTSRRIHYDESTEDQSEVQQGDEGHDAEVPEEEASADDAECLECRGDQESLGPQGTSECLECLKSVTSEGDERPCLAHEACDPTKSAQ